MINATIWQCQFFRVFVVVVVPYFHKHGNKNASLKSPSSGGHLEAVC